MDREGARVARTVARRQAMDQLSTTDKEIVAVLSEHRVATTQQISALAELPERTARCRLDRLWKLGMCGGRQPYADQGSAPYHWWPSRLADAFHRGRELPRGGEREDPEEAFLRHSAAITGLYVALVRLAPTLRWELLAFARGVVLGLALPEHHARQRELVASLHARYPHLPWVLRATRELDGDEPLYHRTWWERHERTKRDLAELKRLQGRMLDYLGWRKHEISNRQWGASVFERHGSRSDRRLARAIDEEQIRACPDCEQLAVPSAHDLRYQVGWCAFCGTRKDLLSLAEAQASGLVEPDGEGFWRVRHGPVPGWLVQGRPLPPLDEDEEEYQ
jgi:hypothetical protein